MPAAGDKPSDADPPGPTTPSGQGGASELPPLDATGAASAPTAPKPPSLFTVVKAGDEPSIKRLVTDEIKALATKHGVDSYEIVFLFDDLDSITDFHSDRIYSVLSALPQVRNILLVVQSRGGKVEPAFLISKTCKKLAREKFVVAVPRKAKSAATLLALGADEIHMGMMSQLGPIDPQINKLPALGLANGLTKISQMVCEYPKSSEMWAKYLTDNLSLWHLGHFERLSESATQYAERLLDGKALPNGQTAKSLGNHFVNHYKDHSFLIDIGEATALLGEETIKRDTPEYAFANEVYQLLDLLEFLLRYFSKKEFYFVGDAAPESLSFRLKSDA
jgi:Serine dehydrogenase proteinase